MQYDTQTPPQTHQSFIRLLIMLYSHAAASRLAVNPNELSVLEIQ